MLCSVPCCEVQHIFPLGFPKEQVQLSKPSIRNKLVLKMVFCRIIVVIMSNLIRKITLYMLCCVPSCDVQQTFCYCLSKRRSQLSKLSIRNKLVLKILYQNQYTILRMSHLHQHMRDYPSNLPFSVLGLSKATGEPLCAVQHQHSHQDLCTGARKQSCKSFKICQVIVQNHFQTCIKQRRI